MKKKGYIQYTVSVWWPGIGKRDYDCETLHTALEVIYFIRDTDKNIKITCKSERRNFPEWLDAIFTDT